MKLLQELTVSERCAEHRSVAHCITWDITAYLARPVGSNIEVTLEIDAEFPVGAPDQVVRIVTENRRRLKFTTIGFEAE